MENYIYEKPTIIEYEIYIHIIGSDTSALTSAYLSAQGLPQFSSTGLTTSPLASVALNTAAAAAAGKQIEGKPRNP